MFETEIERLKAERKTVRLPSTMAFKQFRMLNARGEERDCATCLKIPSKRRHRQVQVSVRLPSSCNMPTGTVGNLLLWLNSGGEILRKNEIRRHGYYYPACKGKCGPILKHMLQGLHVEENPLETDMHRDTELEIMYEDEWLSVVNKPAGMLSVPGKSDIDSVYGRVRRMYPEATGPMIVHRLDMGDLRPDPYSQDERSAPELAGTVQEPDGV